MLRSEAMDFEGLKKFLDGEVVEQSGSKKVDEEHGEENKVLEPNDVLV